VNWRGDSACTDGADVGSDLTGGWYDAGDHVKFGLPMAARATMLAWGIVDYRMPTCRPASSYRARQLKWATDYFIKAHTAPTSCTARSARAAPTMLVGPGRGHADGAAVVQGSSACPGSDLAGETAAALAAASMAFRATDPTYANTLLSHARQLYSFADNFRGKYSDCITDAVRFLQLVERLQR
jgi:hypothetical protein